MSTWSRVVPSIGASALVALGFGYSGFPGLEGALAQGVAPAQSLEVATSVAEGSLMPEASGVPVIVSSLSLERGRVYRLSSVTPIVLDPDPCHEVTEHPDPLPAGTAFLASRSSAFDGVLWYEVRVPEGGQVLGWVSANVLATLGVTAVT